MEERNVEVGVIVSGPNGLGKAWMNITLKDLSSTRFAEMYILPAAIQAKQKYEDLPEGGCDANKKTCASA